MRLNKFLIINCFLLLIFTTACSSATSNIQEQLDLGERYLLENDYEEAILAFDLVLEIEPTNIQAMIGKSNAQYHLGDVNQSVDTFLQGYNLFESLTEDERVALMESSSLKKEQAIEWIQEMLSGLTISLAQKERYYLFIIQIDPKNESAYLELYELYKILYEDQKALDILSSGKTITGSSVIQEELDYALAEKRFWEDYKDIVEELYGLLEMEQFQEAYVLWFDNLRRIPYMVNNQYRFIYYGTNNMHLKLSWSSYYYGEIEQGVAHGMGKAFNRSGSDEQYAMYDGEWKNGQRDGSGVRIWTMNTASGGIQTHTLTGTYKEGYEHGQMKETVVGSNGTIMTSSWTSVEGVRTQIGESSDGYYEYCYYTIVYPDGTVRNGYGRVQEGQIY